MKIKGILYKMAYPQNLSINETNIKTILLDFVYPVGSIYLSLKDTNPKTYLGGEWAKLPEGKALWTASSGVDLNNDENNNIDAGLPNISGEMAYLSKYDNNSQNTGPFIVYSSTIYAQTSRTPTIHYGNIMSFNASRCSEYYGNSDTVQPPAYKVYAWKRTS